MTESKPRLYIKQGCPWCFEAIAFLADHGVDVDLRDVNRSPRDLQRLIEISRRTLTPTLEFGDFLLADFSVAELIEALDRRPEIKQKLGLGPDISYPS